MSELVASDMLAFDMKQQKHVSFSSLFSANSSSLGKRLHAILPIESRSCCLFNLIKSSQSQFVNSSVKNVEIICFRKTLPPSSAIFHNLLFNLKKFHTIVNLVWFELWTDKKRHVWNPVAWLIKTWSTINWKWCNVVWHLVIQEWKYILVNVKFNESFVGTLKMVFMTHLGLTVLFGSATK